MSKHGIHTSDINDVSKHRIHTSDINDVSKHEIHTSDINDVSKHASYTKSWQSVSLKLANDTQNGRFCCRLSRSVALGTFGALTKPKSAANYLPYASKVALGTSGQCSTQASNQSSGAM